MSQILVVEPDGETSRHLAESIASALYEVVITATGSDALEWVDRNGAPDVAVIDLGLRDMRPLNLLAALRARATAAIPTFFVSRKPMRVERFHSAPVLVTPFRPAQARAVLWEAKIESEQRELREHSE